MNTDHNPALTFLAVSCLAVAVTGAFQLASTWHRPTTDQSMHIDAESITLVFASEGAEQEPEPMPIVMPTTYIVAKPDPLSGPAHKCSQGAWFEPRLLEQGSGAVRGFCP